MKILIFPKDGEGITGPFRTGNFGHQTEKLKDIAGQLSFFNEAEANCDESAPEPAMEEVIASVKKTLRKPKKKGQREEDLKGFPQEEILHDISEKDLNEAFGERNWKSMPDEIFWQLRFEPAKWTAERYLLPVYERMKKRQLEAHVNQSDETPVEVIHDGRPAGNKSYMWVHITGELSPVPPIIVYEYQKTRHSDHPKEYYKDYSGVLVTDGLEQYHKLERDLEGVKNANCMAHARRHFANAVKAIGKSNPEAIQASVAYQALVRIGAIYDLEGGLKNLSVQERLKERQVSIKPLVEEFFDWVRKIQTDQTVLPKGETARANGLNVYYYIKHLLTELLNGIRTDGSIDEKELEQLMPWSKNLPPECYSKRRK